MGTAPPGTEVQIYDGEELLGAVVADEEGQWAFVPAEPLAEGERVLTATAGDEKGRVSAPSEAVTITVLPELEAPVITSLEEGEETIERQPEIVGTAPPGTEIQLYDGEEVLGAVVADEEGQWAFVPPEPLAEGERVLTATAGDEKGRVSAPSETVTITIPPVPEPPIITSPRDGERTDEQQLEIKVTTQPGMKVQVYDGDELLKVEAVEEEGHWVFVPMEPLPEGEHVLTATASDKWEQVSEPSKSVTITITPVIIPVTGGSSPGD